jgi:hypothetical protein
MRSGASSICLVANCTGPTHARGLCNKHYARWRKHGDADIAGAPLHIDSDAEYLLAVGFTVTPSGCWEWAGTVDRRGRPHAGRGGKNWLAYRLAYETWVGPVPPGMQLNHHCDNPVCINPGPGHVYVGTAKQNTQDMLSRGRQRKPTGLLTKLTPAQRDDIVRRVGQGETQRSLAAEYGVQASGISKYLTRLAQSK